MAAISMGYGRDKDLGVPIEQANKRAEKVLAALGDEIDNISIYLAEGRAMGQGLIFMSGAELAQFVVGAVVAEICILQEKGMIAKTFPKAAKAEVTDIKGYL